MRIVLCNFDLTSFARVDGVDLEVTVGYVQVLADRADVLAPDC